MLKTMDKMQVSQKLLLQSKLAFKMPTNRRPNHSSKELLTRTYTTSNKSGLQSTALSKVLIVKGPLRLL